MYKFLLTVVCSVMCLAIFNAEKTQARPPAGRTLHSNKTQAQTQFQAPQKVLPPKHEHKHKHKNGGGIDIDIDGDIGGSNDDAADGIDSDDVETKDNALYGVEITALFKGTAAKEGLEIGDIIISFDGTPTPDFDILAKAVARSGKTAQVVVIREDDGKRETVTLYPENGRIGLGGERVRVDDDN